MKKFSHLLIAASFVGVAPAWAVIEKPALPEESPEVAYRYPIVTAPLVARAPKVDGTVAASEWANAAQLAPFVGYSSGVMPSEESRMFIGYTPSALYVAFQFQRPPFALTPVSGTDPKRVWGDDNIELFLRPKFGDNWEYNFVGNAAGVHEEGRRTGNTDKAWEAEWKYAARHTPTGWEGEMEIPFASLGEKSPTPGTVWEMAPWNNQKTPAADVVGWNHMPSYNDKRSLGYLVFGGEVPAARVLKAGETSAEGIGALLEVANTTSQPRTVNVRTVLYRPKDAEQKYFELVDATANPLGPQAEAIEYVKAAPVVQETLGNYTVIQEQTKNLTIPAGGSQRVTFAPPAAIGNYVLYYEIRESGDNGKILSAGPLPFFHSAPLSIAVTPFTLSARAVQAVANYRKIESATKGDIVAIEWRDAASKKVLHSREAPLDMIARQTVLNLPSAGLQPGPYRMRVLIKGADGKIKAEREEPYVLPATPVWWGNNIGKADEIKDIVPEPWTPMVKTANGFDVWNRKVRLGELLQPQQITAGTTSMLPRAAKLDTSLAGIKWSNPELVKARNSGITYRQAFQGTNVHGELLLESEFDGFMKYTLKLSPESQNGAANLDKLVLEVPLDPQIARHYRTGVLGDISSHAEVGSWGKIGDLPEEGLTLPFTQTMWLGNDTFGFEWSTESNQWWSPKDKKAAVQVVRNADATILRINFVESPRQLKGAVQFQWALLPTPTKPMNEELQHNLRYVQGGWRLNESLTDLEEKHEKEMEALVAGGANAFGQWSWSQTNSLWNPDFTAAGYRPGTLYNDMRAKAFRKATDMAYEKGFKWVTAYALWNIPKDWPDVGELWREQALYPITPSWGGYLYCPSQAFNDWYMHTMKNTVEQTGINGVYLDSSADPRPCTNMNHGHGYVDDDGKVRVTYPVWGARELHKRIYQLFHGEAKKGGLVYAHNTHFPFMAVESFVDVHHCGEGSDLHRELFIPKFYGRPFGVPVSFTRWNNPIYKESRMRSWRVALQLDSTIKASPNFIYTRAEVSTSGNMTREQLFKGYEDQSEVVYQIWQAQRDFPYEQAQWIPFWKAAPYANTGDDDLLPAMHLVPGKVALVVVSSFKEEPANLNLKLNWKNLGFDPAKVTMVDSITGEVLKPTADGVTLEVLDNRWRMFSIKPTQ